MSLASIVCANSDTIEKMQPLAFLQYSDSWNARIPCEKIARVNLDLWKDEPVGF